MTGSVKLTVPQRRELLQLLYRRQHTYGRYRTRVQNTLVRLRLARFVEQDGSGLCEITAAGCRWLLANP